MMVVVVVVGMRKRRVVISHKKFQLLTNELVFNIN